MLAKIYDHEYRTRVPSTQSWLLRHHDWTLSYIVWEQMCTYQDIDAAIVQVVRQSLLQNVWHLTAHLVILAFFMSLRFLVWRKLWLHKFICILKYLSMLSRSMEMLPLSMLSIWFSFRWLVIKKKYSLMSLNVTITQPITLYLLEQYCIPLKPLLGCENCSTYHYFSWTDSIKPSLLFSYIWGSL